MKRHIVLGAVVCSCALLSIQVVSAQFGGALRGLGKKAIDKASEPKPEPEAKPAEPETKPPAEAEATPSEPAAAKTASATDTPASGGKPNYKAYQNYDFVPGEKIIFEDDFVADRDGEFPAHWKLLKGQGVVNNVEGRTAFALTEGNYAEVMPRVTTPKYLAETFTVEFDFYPKAGGFEKGILFLQSGEKETHVVFGSEVTTEDFEEGSANQNARYPGGSDGFTDKWHHAALVFRGNQIKCYEDQYRVLVIPDAGGFKPESIKFGGIGDPGSPVIFTNVRVANGGGMTMIDKLAKEGRIVSHGILFDVNKSVVKPESMGTVQQIAAALKSDPSLKLEIGGHTDSDGDAAKNLALSEARANAVRTLLVEQGVGADRLTARGYGATKPLEANTTAEGKANNRRVEFVKQ